MSGCRLEAIYHNTPTINQATQEIKISEHLNLKDACIWELDFLRIIDLNRHIFYNEEFLKVSVRRYEKYWLPLLATLSDSNVEDLKYAPPLDVHWVWHVHMLAPVQYRMDCMAVVGDRVLNHALQSLDVIMSNSEMTRVAWKRRYPNVPFDFTDLKTYKEGDTPSAGPDEEKQPPGAEGFRSKITYDIVNAAMRQGAFYYQVSLPHYKDREFMADGIVRYKMFLALKKENKDKFIVPCYDIDLAWHTHQVHPALYYQDTMEILGFVLKHDDSVNDRSEGSKLNMSDEVTRKLWHQKFQVPFPRPGSMFRGNPPHGKLAQLSKSYQAGLLAPKEMSVELEGISLKVPPRVKTKISSALESMSSPKKQGLNGAETKNGESSDGLPTTPISVSLQLMHSNNKQITLYTRDVPSHLWS